MLYKLREMKNQKKQWQPYELEELIEKFDDPVVLLSDQVETSHPNVIDASGFSFWGKIVLAAKAEAFYGAHSGFGGICASYAKKSYVINPSAEGAYRNPSLVLFDNVKWKDNGVHPQYEFNGPYVDYKEHTLQVREC